jgi:uncharacterized membrane protein
MSTLGNLGGGTIGGPDAGNAGSVAHRVDDLTLMTATMLTGFVHTAVVRSWTITGESESGNPIGEWVDGDETPAMLVHADSREVTQERNAQISDWFIRLPPGTAVSGLNQIRVTDVPGFTDPLVFEVLGPPEVLPTHIHANLQHVSG